MRLSNVEKTNTEIASLINDFVHSQRDRQILKLRYVDGWTIDSLAEEFQLSNESIKNVIRKFDKYLV